MHKIHYSEAHKKHNIRVPLYRGLPVVDSVHQTLYCKCITFYLWHCSWRRKRRVVKHTTQPAEPRREWMVGWLGDSGLRLCTPHCAAALRYALTRARFTLSPCARRKDDVVCIF